MTLLALGLVLISAVCHATWNYLAKRIGGGGVPFIWLIAAGAALLYAPIGIAVWLIERPVMGVGQFAFIVGSAVIHLVYFVLLTRGYRTGDLSMVYPLARGTGPLLSTLGAILLLGERPLPVALVGAVLIAASIIILTGNPYRLWQARTDGGIGYALLTGLTIAVYTLWDKQAVTLMLIPPLMFDWLSNVTRAVLLYPYVRGQWDKVQHHWQHHRREVMGVALLSSLSYILVLTALTFSPVTYIAPAREMSIVIGAYLGSRLLAEQESRRRSAAAVVMMLGVMALALG
jgi:drug/metabolite transporter (DMT)-like permease